MIATRLMTWVGSLFIWLRLRPAEEAPLQEEAVAVKTRFWLGILLTEEPASKFVLRVLTPTATRKFLLLEKKGRLHRMDRWWARFTTTTVMEKIMEEVKLQVWMEILWVSVLTTAFVVAENRSLKIKDRG